MNRIILSTFVIFFINFSISYATDEGKGCHEIRGVFDIGSGSTKLKVFKWDRCKESLVSVIDECSKHKKVSYKEDLKTSDELTSDTLQLGLKYLKKLKSMAISCGATKFAGAATSAFRQAKNGQQAADFLMKNSGVNIEIVTQYQEAMLGFKGAKLKSGEKENVCVWDIGGSSMQIICELDSGKLVTYLGQLASVPFKNEILKIKNSQAISPNPIGKNVFNSSKLITRKEGEKIKRKLGEIISNNKVIGIGGVHYYAVSKRIGKRSYSSQDLLSWITENINKNDGQLGGGDFVDTLVSNVILVEGLINTLKIKKVKAFKVNLTDGVLASPRFWSR